MTTTASETLSPFTVGGRRYVPVVPRCWGQVQYLTTQLRASGIATDGAGDIMDALLAHGRLPNLIAASYTPAGVPWTRDGADILADHLYRLTEPADIATLNQVAEAVLADFFGLAVSSVPISPAASLIQALDQMAQSAGTTSLAASAPSSGA